MQTDRTLYIVEIDSRGCSNCGDEAGYVVIGPDGVEESPVYNNRGDAEEIANLMNSACEQGRRAAAWPVAADSCHGLPAWKSLHLLNIQGALTASGAY